MTDLTTTINTEAPITLAVQIDPRRAQLLWHNGAPVVGFDLEGRFELLDGDDWSDLYGADAWTDGRIMWCAGVLDAITLATYETNNGFTAHLLWDLATGPDWPDGYAVLTSRPWGS